MLGPIDLSVLLYAPCPNSLDGLMMDPTTGAYECCSACDYTGVGDEVAVDWVIVGAESGRDARWLDNADAVSVVSECVNVGTAVFVKQLSGEKGRPVTDISLFPSNLQIREFPRA